MLLSRRDKKRFIQCKDNFQKLKCSVSSDIPKSIRFGHKLLFEKKQDLEKNGSSGTICFKTNCITTTNGEVFEVRDGKVCKKDEPRRKAFKRPRLAPQRDVVSENQGTSGSSKKSKSDKSKIVTPTNDYAFRNSTTSQRRDGVPTASQSGVKVKGGSGSGLTVTGD